MLTQGCARTTGTLLCLAVGVCPKWFCVGGPSDTQIFLFL